MTVATQVSYFFELAELAWAEVYYWQSDGNDATLCIQDAQNLGVARAKFLATNANMPERRISELEYGGDGNLGPNILRDAPLVTLDETGVSNGTAVGGGNAQYAQMVLWRCQNTTWGMKRSIMSRGAPTSYWAYDASRPFGPAFPPLLDAASKDWRDQLTRSAGTSNPSGTWCIKAVVRENSLNPKVPVLSVAAGNPPAANWTITLAEDDARWTPGVSIKVGGMRGPWSSGLNRICTIKSKAFPALTLVQMKINDCPINYNGKGYVKGQFYQLFPISTVDFVRFVIRDTGVSANTTRGRARNNPTHSRYY